MDVEVVDGHDDVGSGVGSSDADVVECFAVAEGHASGLVDDVSADSGCIAPVPQHTGVNFQWTPDSRSTRLRDLREVHYPEAVERIAKGCAK